LAATTVRTVPVASIKADPEVQIRKSTREEAIRRYEESFDRLPPVVVYELAGGQLLLADGFNRLAAALRLGLTSIQAEVRPGTRDDALEFAVVANCQSGEPLTREEIAAGVQRLRLLHGDSWSARKIADTMSIGRGTVQRVLTVDDVRKHVAWRPVGKVDERVLLEVAGADRSHWEKLVRAADRRRWTVDGVRQAVKNLADDSIPEERRRKILEGEADPVVREGDALRTPVGLVERAGRGAQAAEDPVGSDVAERLHPVRFTVSASYYMPSERTRMRGNKEYPREAELTERAAWMFNFGAQALSWTPQQMAQELGRAIWRKLEYEGWPVQVNVGEEGS
jgi:ParB-like chromosome segregation protein Spo0J